MGETFRVVIADDHPMFRSGLAALVDRESGFEVIGEASSGDAAVALAAELQPDIILMDIKMPGLSGIEATREVRRVSSQSRILVITMFEDDQQRSSGPGMPGSATYGQSNAGSNAGAGNS
jgi:DNA-binding NarL/FixJ family response regulator